MTPPDATTTRTGARLKPDQRIAELIAAARTLLAEVGYERFLPAELARRCGVSEATVYRYFPTKRELLVRVAQEWLDEVLGVEPDLAGYASASWSAMPSRWCARNRR
jgi:AcrR family transcriptional regulator